MEKKNQQNTQRRGTPAQNYKAIIQSLMAKMFVKKEKDTNKEESIKIGTKKGTVSPRVQQREAKKRANIRAHSKMNKK